MSLDTTQRAAIEKLSKLKAGALFMKMGTGKTRTAVLIAEGREHDFDTLVWIAPASLLRENDYVEEIYKWMYKLTDRVAFYSVEAVSASDTKFLELHALASTKRCFCVVDESLDIKNAEAGRTKRLLGMRDLFAFRLILNGTPISKGLIDLYAQIQFIHPNILKMTEAQFASNFLQYKKDGYRPWLRWSKPENEEALIETIRPYIFDADLEIDVPLHRREVNLRLSNKEKAGYEALKEDFLNRHAFPPYLATAQAFQAHYTLAESKMKELCETMSGGGKTIIFVKFLREVEALRELYPTACVNTGYEKADLQRFKRESDVLIMTYGTGSRGLNLQHANRVIFFSQTFNWMHKIHGLHRAYRTGQRNSVSVIDYRLDTGLERILEASEKKKVNAAENIGRFIQENGASAL